MSPASLSTDHKVKVTVSGDDNYRVSERIASQLLAKLSHEKIPVAKLVKDLSGELACKPDKIVSEIIRLQNDSKILITERSAYRRFWDYLRSPISLWFWELAVATIVSLGLVYVSSGLVLYLRYVFGGMLILFLPGYAFLGFIYFKKADLDPLTKTSVSFVMSLALTTLVGLVLSFTPFGITLIPVALSIASITIGLLILTSLRKYSYYRLVNVTT
jgi:uncharacterized protein DUF1616